MCLVLQQSEQKSPPQCRQWCRRRLSVKPFSQPEHAAWPSSAAHSRFVFAVAGAPTVVSSICSSSGCSCFRRFRRMAGSSELQPDPSELRVRRNAVCPPFEERGWVCEPRNGTVTCECPT